MKEIIEVMETFETICGQARNHNLFLALRGAFDAGMDKVVIEKAFCIAKEKGGGHPHYAAAVIRNFLKRGILREDDLPGRKKTVSERLYLTQKEPVGELLDWEKQWLREMGR